MLNVKVLKTIVNDGILYEIVEKPETIYAGKLESSDTNKGEPDIKSILGGYREISSKITGAVDEAWWLGISMNYGNDKVPAAICLLSRLIQMNSRTELMYIKCLPPSTYACERTIITP